MVDDQPEPDHDPEGQPGAAFVDRRVDEEKLNELLTFPEGTHLEFKSTVDIDSREGKVKFAKDVVAMSNCPPGGYILVGIDDAGQRCAEIGTFDRDQFDASRLQKIVRSYAVEGYIELKVGIHERPPHEVIVLYVAPQPTGLPIPMSKTGDYPDPKKPDKNVTLFKPGEVPVREGADIVPLRHAHWVSILAHYEGRIRGEATETAQAILREFLAQLNESRSESPTGIAAGTPDAPLLIDMGDESFVNAMHPHLDSGERGTQRLRRFLKRLAKQLNSRTRLDRFENAMDKWTIFCAQAIYVERFDLVDAAIATLRDEYVRLGLELDDSRKRLAVVIRIYAVGSMAIREQAWQTVRSLTLQPVPSNAYDSAYIYSSWIRHGQVDGSRMNLIPERGGFLISAPRELLADHPAMRPDVDDDEIPEPSDALAADDVLLNSLCQFDLAYCFIAAASGEHNGGGYPSSTALKGFRSSPIADTIVQNVTARQVMLPGVNDQDLATILTDVYQSAEREAMRYGTYWDSPPAMNAFVRKHRPDTRL